jgi:ADP-heptose:LPS heptosyltransferase
MKTLIIKLNATGDVVRTTVLLHRLSGEVTWITAGTNTALLHGLRGNLRCVSWEERDRVKDDQYDLLINLEDEVGTAEFARGVRHRRLFGAYLTPDGRMSYTDDARQWFDLSLISVHGRKRADVLKYENRASYQELVYAGLGWKFSGEKYLLPAPVATDLHGDVALAPVAGAVWPMKSWAHYDRLKAELEGRGLKVNVLPRRQSLLEHLGDVSQHRCLVGGDSLPMHLAMAAGVSCVTIFNCTSPWEIYDYGLQTKMISPLLGEHFYSRQFDPRATTAITLDEVLSAVLARLERGG